MEDVEGSALGGSGIFFRESFGAVENGLKVGNSPPVTLCMKV